MRLAEVGLVQSCHYKQKIHSHKALQRKYTDLFASSFCTRYTKRITSLYRSLLSLGEDKVLDILDEIKTMYSKRKMSNMLAKYVL